MMITFQIQAREEYTEHFFFHKVQNILSYLRTFAEELTPVWCPTFQQSLDSHTVPALWKKTVITPVPKKPCPIDNNDYRPIALAAVVMKCLDKYTVSLLKADINPL